MSQELKPVDGEQTEEAQVKTPEGETQVAETEPEGVGEQAPVEKPEGETPEGEGEQAGETDESATEAEAPEGDRVVVGGVDVTDAATEFAEKGELSADSYAALAEQGFSKEIVDRYLEGVRAEGASYDNALYAAAGGDKNEAAFDSLLKAASGFVTQAEADRFNAAVSSGDASIAAMAVENLRLRVEAQEGRESSRESVGGGQGGSTNTDVFASKEEMITAMRDPRYKKDKAYIDAVADKLARSRKAGTL